MLKGRSSPAFFVNKWENRTISVNFLWYTINWEMLANRSVCENITERYR